MSTEHELASSAQSSANNTVELMSSASNQTPESLSMASTAVLSSMNVQNGDDTEEQCFIRSTN